MKVIIQTITTCLINDIFNMKSKTLILSYAMFLLCNVAFSCKSKAVDNLDIVLVVRDYNSANPQIGVGLAPRENVHVKPSMSKNGLSSVEIIADGIKVGIFKLKKHDQQLLVYSECSHKVKVKYKNTDWRLYERKNSKAVVLIPSGKHSYRCVKK